MPANTFSCLIASSEPIISVEAHTIDSLTQTPAIRSTLCRRCNSRERATRTKFGAG